MRTNIVIDDELMERAMKATGLVDVDGIVEQLKIRFGRIAEGNIRAFKRAYEECVCEEK